MKPVRHSLAIANALLPGCAMQDKQMPRIGLIDIAIIEEEHARFLAFDSGQLDLVELSDSAAPKVLDKDKPRSDHAAKGISLYHYTPPAITYDYFNMRAPLAGGHGLDKIALRHAIEQARLLPEGPQRQALYNNMMRQIEADTVISLNLRRVQGFKRHPIPYGDWRYPDLDLGKR